MAFRWLENFLIRRASARVAAGIAGGETAIALAAFDERLARYGSRVDPALRATVYLLRWIAAPSDRDLAALRELAAASPQAAHAFRVVQRLDFALRLSAALHGRENRSLAQLRAVRGEGSDADTALQRLALALLEARAGTSRTGPENVLTALPHEAPPAFERACLHLRTWALVQREQYEQVATDGLALRILGDEAAREVCIAAALGWSQRAIRAANLSAARHALAIFAGAAALPPELANALAALACGRHASGRELLRNLQSEHGAHARHLAALSLLASTHEWPEPADTTVRVNNRALWRGLRSELDPLVHWLCERDDWRGFLLAGLVARVDSGIAFDLDAIHRFAAAADHVHSTVARTRLRDIEASLTLRARATEEAVALIRQHRYDALRDLNATVLSTSPDSVPPLVRAAVSLALFHHDPSYDPLPDLARLVPTAEEQPLIEQCATEVRIAQTLRTLASRCLDRGNAVPPLDAVRGADGELVRLAQTAAAIVYSRAGELEDAQRLLPEGDDPRLARLRFHIAWRRGDAEACLALAPEERAVQVLALLHVADGEASRSARELLARIGGDVQQVVASMVVWLLGRDKGAAAQTLLQRVREESADAGLAIELDPFVNARLGRFSAVIDAVDRLAASTADRDPNLYAWCRFLRIEADLALAAQAADAEVKTRWRSIQRALDECRGTLGVSEPLQTYASLLHGLFAFIATDTWVDEPTIDGLAEAQLLLPLDTRAAFLDNAIGKLRWRQRVVAAFWEGLRSGQLKQARLIFHDELLPVFGERMPSAIQLGMILVDWGVGAAPAGELLRRLDLLVEEAPELKGEVADQTRRYIQDGEQLRRTTALLQEQQYERLFDEVSRSTWSGLDAGSVPVPVAIAQLFACFKLRKDDIVEGFGAQIAAAQDLASWSRDDASLLLGYVRFDKEDYAAAAAAFENTSSATLLGHDVDRYTAAAWFREGRKLLEKTDQRDKAFDAFRRALQRGHAAPSASLAPLFLHFGLKAVETNEGGRAVQAFTLLADDLAKGEQTPEVVKNWIRARIGVLACQRLMAGEIKSDDVRDLLKKTDEVEVERVLRILLIGIGLRCRMPKIVREELDALEALEPKLGRRDPLVRVLSILLDVVVEKKRVTSERLGILEDALRLGVRSERLRTLLQHERDLMKAAIERTAKAFDLMDAWLAAGVVSPKMAGELVRDDDLSELYRLHHGYEPGDIVGELEPSGVAPLCARLKHLAEFAESSLEDQAAHEHASELKKAVEKLERAEKQARELEPKVMLRVAAWLKGRPEQGGKDDQRPVARGTAQKRPRASRPQ